MASALRVVVITRPTELEAALARHGTLGQARFYLEERGRSIELLRERQAAQDQAVAAVGSAIPTEWRRAGVRRHELDRFLFGPDDIVVVVGQDGLVANVAKYLDGQPVVGVNPDPDRYDGVLARHRSAAVVDLLADLAAERSAVEERTMVAAVADDGQRLTALNEIFVGHRSHQSARYVVRWGEATERQSSSGVIVTTGTGATGWARSISEVRGSSLELPRPTDPTLAFFVREPFPSVATGTSITEGTIPRGRSIEIDCELTEGGVVFGDGIETDHVALAWGQRLEIRAATRRLRLVA
jgi:hypothetical protein